MELRMYKCHLRYKMHVNRMQGRIQQTTEGEIVQQRAGTCYPRGDYTGLVSLDV